MIATMRMRVLKHKLRDGEKDILTGVEHPSGTDGLLASGILCKYFTTEDILERDFAIITEALELLAMYWPSALRMTHAECLALYMPRSANLQKEFGVDCSINDIKERIRIAARYHYYKGNVVVDDVDETTPIGWWLKDLLKAVDRGEFYFASYAITMVYTLACSRAPIITPWSWYWHCCTVDSVRREFGLMR